MSILTIALILTLAAGKITTMMIMEGHHIALAKKTYIKSGKLPPVLNPPFATMRPTNPPFQ